VAATSTFLDPEVMERTFHGESTGCYLYSRHSNPTVNAFGRKLAALEGMPACLGVASGMAAIYCSLRQLMPEGGRLVASRTIYGGTYALFKNLLPKIGIDVEFADFSNRSTIERAITEKTKVVYTESMSNPLLNVADFESLRELKTKLGFKLVVDNTFTPTILSPGRWGADVVIYSGTKYLSGASDCIAGAILSDQEFINQLIDLNHGVVMLTGPVMDPRVAHELYLRLDHLPLRMRAHSNSATYLAKLLHREKVPVIYPGLEEHPDHARMKTLMNERNGFGGMIVVDCRTAKRAMSLARRLQESKFGLYAVSLGFSRTLLSCPSLSTSSEIPETEQRAMGLSEGFLRMSIGYVGNDTEMGRRFLTAYQSL
jgi:methionine-gamma-lyase